MSVILTYLAVLHTVEANAIPPNPALLVWVCDPKASQTQQRSLKRLFHITNFSPPYLLLLTKRSCAVTMRHTGRGARKRAVE